MGREQKRVVAIVLVLVLLGVGVWFFKGVWRRESVVRKEEVEMQVGKVKASVEIGRKFEFEAVNQKKEKRNVGVSMVSCEKKNEIKVQDEVRKAAKGKEFLLIRLEMENTFPEKLAITPSELVRMEVAGKKFAPDYHNGTVVLDPLSVKKDLVAFLVEAKTGNFVFLVGELEGEKERVEVNF